MELLTKEEKTRVMGAIEEAEKNTSGEIRVHIEPVLKEDVLDRAADVFKLLGMHKTEQRNGVLFYVATESRKFAILGDAGINSKVPADFWDMIKEELQKFFTEGKFAEGLSRGILMAGEQLKAHFPYNKEDSNELTNDISFGNR